MKVAIVGSRGVKDFDISRVVPQAATAIVSGGAAGVDTIAASFAKSKGLQLIEFLPEYEKYGRSAPIVRNRLIVDAADLVIAIWDGRSRGTLSTINFAKKAGKTLCLYDTNGCRLQL